MRNKRCFKKINKNRNLFYYSCNRKAPRGFKIEHAIAADIPPLVSPKRRHGSTRVLNHAFLAWRSSWRCVPLQYKSSLKFHQLAAGQLLSEQTVWNGKGRRYSQSITYKITLAESLSSSQSGGPPCWASPLAFGLIEYPRYPRENNCLWDWISIPDT